MFEPNHVSAKHDRQVIEAEKAGRTLARDGNSRAYVNKIAKDLPVNEADALLAGYYAELRRIEAWQGVTHADAPFDPID